MGSNSSAPQTSDTQDFSLNSLDLALSHQNVHMLILAEGCFNLAVRTKDLVRSLVPRILPCKKAGLEQRSSVGEFGEILKLIFSQTLKKLVNC